MPEPMSNYRPHSNEVSTSGAHLVGTGQSARGRRNGRNQQRYVDSSEAPLFPSQELSTVQVVPSRGRGWGPVASPAVSLRSVGDAPGLLRCDSNSTSGSEEPIASTATSTSFSGFRSITDPQARSIRGRGRGVHGRGLAFALTATSNVIPCPPSQILPHAGDSGAHPEPQRSKPFLLTELQKALEALPKVGANSKRNSRGTTGTAIQLRSNCYALEFPDTVWYKYDVAIYRGNEKEGMELENLSGVKARDRIASRYFNRKIMLKVFHDHNRYLGSDFPAYDGRKILIMNHRPFEEDEKYFNVIFSANNQREMEFTVRLKLTLKIDVSSVKSFYKRKTNVLDPEVIQAVNIVIDTSFGNAGWVAVGRSYFNPGSIAKPLGRGKEMREGIYTSAMFAQWQPLLCIDKARAAFTTPKPLIDYACDMLELDKQYLRTSTFRSEQIATLNKELKALMVKLEHTSYGRSVKISGITMKGANQMDFQKKDGTQTLVADYFRSAYPEFRLNYPHLPCIEVIRANGTKIDYFPMEVCTLKKDQPSRKRLDPKQTEKMIRFAQDQPQSRLDFSEKNVSKISSGRSVQEFGIKIAKQATRTVGRIIKDPGILVGEQSIQVSVGSWKLPAFHEAVEVRQWVIVDCAGVRAQQLNKLHELLHTRGNVLNMKIPPAANVFSSPNWQMPARTQHMLEDIQRFQVDKGLPILAVIVLGHNSKYSEIKSLTETNGQFRDIVTQCVKSGNVNNDKKFNLVFVENLLKKINAKLGGVNNLVRQVPQRFREQYMILGADVSHPAPGDTLTPSIAAVVGSMDYKPSKYCTEICVQCSEDNNRVEYIINMRRIFLKLLKQHIECNNNVKPKHIYYFRDGVSDSQFEEVRIREVTAIREACYDLQVHYQPFITVVVAQKRHHVRFAVVNTLEGTKSGNIPPGTYIDNDVVHPINHDLYMYTHEGLLGTSRPTHYQVIHSDCEIQTDELTEMIYYLTHNYVRASKSVSIPSPIYYAHLAAF
ncbi:protein argonaute-3-like, partial [Tropilaelaps mercedesae]